MWTATFLVFSCHCHLHIDRNYIHPAHSSISTSLTALLLKKKIKQWNPFKNKIHQEYKCIDEIKALCIWLKQWVRVLFPPISSSLPPMPFPTRPSASPGKILRVLLVLGNKMGGIFWVMMMMTMMIKTRVIMMKVANSYWLITMKLIKKLLADIILRSLISAINS